LAGQVCPFRNLPEPTKGRWGEDLTAEDLKKCRWLGPHLVAAIEFVEWTSESSLLSEIRCVVHGSRSAKSDEGSEAEQSTLLLFRIDQNVAPVEVRITAAV
jgi:hypothetical protein